MVERAEDYMSRAISLARRGAGKCSPNPMVGAVVVSNGAIVGEGWHKGPGTEHAERAAIGAAGASSKGGDLYLSLEPCAHWGRTGPCTEAIVEHGMRRVFAAMLDPDPKVNGKGVAALRAAGIETEVGLGSSAARKLNQAYVVHRELGRPFVTYKAALSLDGRTAAADGSSKWITSEAARVDAHKLRAQSDAICVGVGTLLSDDPELTARGVRVHRQPLAVVVDSTARAPVASKIFRREGPVMVVVGGDASTESVEKLRALGADVVSIPGEDGRVMISKMLQYVGDKGVLSLLLEGGPTLASAFAAASVIDRYVIYAAPVLMGGPDTPGLLEGWSAASMGDARQLRVEAVRRIGQDLRIDAVPRG